MQPGAILCQWAPVAVPGSSMKWCPWGSVTSLCVLAEDWNLQVISSRIQREQGGMGEEGDNSVGGGDKIVMGWVGLLCDQTPVCEAACIVKIIN